MSMGAWLGCGLSAEERLQKCIRTMDRSILGAQIERSRLEKEERRILRTTRSSHEMGNMEAYESGYDTLSVIHKAIAATVQTEGQLQRLKLRLQKANTSNDMARCMSEAAKAMESMNATVTPTRMQSVIRTFDKEESDLETKQEWMDDAHYDADTEERSKLLKEEHEARQADEMASEMPPVPISIAERLSRDIPAAND